MKQNWMKWLIGMVVLAALVVALKPYVAVSVDEWGVAISVRTSEAVKFTPVYPCGE
jgi:hypothetical protein